MFLRYVSQNKKKFINFNLPFLSRFVWGSADLNLSFWRVGLVSLVLCSLFPFHFIGFFCNLNDFFSSTDLGVVSVFFYKGLVYCFRAIWFVLMLMCVCVVWCVFVNACHICVDIHIGQKRGAEALELQLQVPICYQHGSRNWTQIYKIASNLHHRTIPFTLLM